SITRPLRTFVRLIILLLKTSHPTLWDSILGNDSRRQSQLPAHQVLHSAGNHQRLWHAAQRREGELLACIANGTRGKIDLDLVTGNNRLFLARDRIGKLCAQPVHQTGRLDAEKAVVECVTQIGLREAARDHQWNALVFKRRHRLLATGTRAEIEAPDYDVSLTRAPSKLRIVI